MTKLIVCDLMIDGERRMRIASWYVVWRGSDDEKVRNPEELLAVSIYGLAQYFSNQT
jgi:hypothetical protein